MQRAVHQVITEEERASQDRLLACQIAGVAPSPLNIALQVVAGATELAAFIRYASVSGPTELSPDDGPVPSACHGVEIGESSSSANRTKENSERTTKMICSACREEKNSFDILHALCGHEYCRDCIANFFSLSTFDESVFPPRCCQQEISVDLATEMLSPELRTRFLKTAEKFHTLIESSASAHPVLSSYHEARSQATSAHAMCVQNVSSLYAKALHITEIAPRIPLYNKSSKRAIVSIGNDASSVVE